MDNKIISICIAILWLFAASKLRKIISSIIAKRNLADVVQLM